MSTASSAQRLTTTDALSYLKIVKEMFQDKRDKYSEFLDIMKDFKAQRVDTSGVILRVKELFKGYRDLILGFNTFLPKGYEITLPPEDEPFLRKKPVEFDEAISFVNKIKTRFQGDDHVYKAFLDVLNMYRKDNKSITEVYQEVSVLFQGHADLLVEFTHFLPDTSCAATVQYGQPGRTHTLHGDDRPNDVEKKIDVSYVHTNHPDSEQWNHVEKEKGKRVERDRSEWENDDSLDRKRKYARRDESTLAQFYRAMEESELSFREKVKERLQAPENYEKVSDCISSFKSKFVTAAQFRTLVASLIGKHPDLMEMGEEFITYIEKYGSIRNNKVPRSSKAEEDGDDHDRDDKAKDHDNRERDRYDRGLAFSKDASGQRISYSNKEKFLAKPIHELDLSESKSCTPSYRRLPDNYPIPPSSCRTEIGTQVLNDHWVSVTSGSEDYSFKHMRKNQYEESLFRCEDDRFELDMLLESVNTTVKRVEDILDRMNAHTNKASSSYLEELSALNLRCIERLYGDHGLDVMDVLRKNAPLALPVILTRLKQKQEEWARCRADFNKVWAEIYAKNYHKSLDHRSFYFKQQDTKNLSAKALLAEIKELSEKNQTEDGLVLLSIAAGYKQPIKPDMEFEYVDADIQEDLYQLMEYSSGEVCTPDQSDKVMKIWSNFIDLVFEVYSHPPVTGDKEENAVKATKNPVAENVSNTVEENCIPTPDTLLCDAPGNEPMQIDDNMISAKSCASQQAGGLLKEEASSSAGVKNVNEENVSDALKGPDAADGSLRKEAMLSQGPLKRTSSPISKAPKGSSPIAKVQKLREETEACAKNEREEGELSPNRNLEEVADMCIDRAPEENDAMAEDEGEDSASDNSDNPSEENGDVSGSESANGKGEDENDQKADESEGEVDARENEGSTSFSDRSLRTARPLAINLLTKTLGKEENRVFYGNDSFYLLFRLHHMLYERMLSAKLHSSSSENRWRVSKEHADSYARFKDALRNLLNGSSDNAKFEDECRAIIGAQSYVLFTLDKLIHKLVKQVQTIASDEIDNKLLHLYVYERLRNPGTFSDEVYFANARFLVPDDNLYRIECLPCPERLTIQLMINEHDKFEPTAVSMDPDFLSYLKDELLGDVPQKLGKPWVFLRRNKRKLYNGDDISNFDKAMEGLIVHNGMEIKVHSVTKKIAYVLDTEDFLYRKKSRRQSLYRASTCDASSSAASNGNSKSKSIKRGNLLFS